MQTLFRIHHHGSEIVGHEPATIEATTLLLKKDRSRFVSLVAIGFFLLIRISYFTKYVTIFRPSAYLPFTHDCPVLGAAFS